MTRIIAGRAKGLRLAAPKGDATRPTTDRVREALFSALVSWFDAVDRPTSEQFDGIAVLDLYAGTGAVGLEAASRGASPVTLVDHRTATTIRDNACRAGLRVEVRASRAEHTLEAPGGPWDLVFIDPPYEVGTEAVNRVLGLLAGPGVMAAQGLVVVERSKRSEAPAWAPEFTERWERGYGETVLHFGATAPAGGDDE